MISRITQLQPKTSQSSQKNNLNKNNNNPSFKGPVELGTQTLNWLNTSPAIGACFVDFFSMVMPRTIVDFSRSKDAGMETGIRESSGTLNHAFAGIVGLGAGYVVSSAFNRANGVKTHLVFANSDTIDTFGKFMANSVGENGKYDATKYWETFFKGLEGLNTTNGAEAWKTLSEQAVKDAAKVMVDAGTEKYKTPKSALAKAIEIVTKETGAGSTFKVYASAQNGEKVATNVEGSIENLIHNAFSLRKTVLDKAAHDKTDIVKDLDKFLKGVKNKKVATVAAGLAIPVGVGMSVQPINRYLTKKRTGSDGFVGVEGREPDKSFGFKVMKAVLGVGIGSAMIATILKHPSELYTNLKKAGPELLSKLQYRGAVPTLDQFKFIYGMTIMSRIFAARDKNETRESIIKDTLGFANWLILGGFVSKLAAKAMDKNIVNYSEKIHGKGLWNYITKSVEKTHEEILYPVLEKLNIKVMDGDKKIPFKKLMNEVKKAAKADGPHKEIAQKAIKQLKYKNYAQLLGYIYSGVVLGWGIPKLNIAITKAVEGKKSAKQPQEKQTMKVAAEPFAQPLEPDTKTFAAFGAYLN